MADARVEAEDWRRIFPDDRTIRRDQLDALEVLDGGALLGALRRYIHPIWSFPPLGAEQVKALRAVIHPEILLGDGVSLAALDGEPRVLDDRQDVLQVMDLGQEEHAQAMGSGHRIIYGVAGSGKTIIVLARAQRLAETGTKRILVTCFNRTLAAWMREQLSGYPAITVMNFHAWAWQVGFRERQYDSDELWGARLLEHLGSRRGGTSPYEAILVDEGQDFEPDWFRCLLAAMKDPENGDLLIAADGCQSLYRRGRIRWSDLGIKARGRTVSGNYGLDRNYRNSREIIALAESFACAAANDADNDAIQAVRVNMAHCERGTGATPRFIRCGDRREELRQAADLGAELLGGRWLGRPIGAIAPEEIGILYPAADADGKLLLGEFTGWLERKTPVVWLSEDSSARDGVGNSGVKIQTIHSAKGLQYRAVIIVWADKLPRSGTSVEELVAERRQLYVAMTRAVSFLAITASGKSIFMDEIGRVPGISQSERPVVIPPAYRAGEASGAMAG